MSTYNEITKHPSTGKFENAVWMDDYFGQHNYGVRFPDGSIYDPTGFTMETLDLDDLGDSITELLVWRRERERNNKMLAGIRGDNVN